MGTAGPLALANEILNDGSGDPFFVLNRHDRRKRSTTPNNSFVALVDRAMLHAACQNTKQACSQEGQK